MKGECGVKFKQECVTALYIHKGSAFGSGATSPSDCPRKTAPKNLFHKIYVIEC